MPGVSTRGYERSLEPRPTAATVRGVSKRAVLERFVYGTERQLAELMSRDRRQLQVVALLIDRLHFGEHVVLAAVGADDHGDKHLLGLRGGAGENAAAVWALLAALVERGLRKVAGYRAMPILLAALRAQAAQFNRKVDDTEKAA